MENKKKNIQTPKQSRRQKIMMKYLKKNCNKIYLYLIIIREKNDVFSLGVMALEMMNLKTFPFNILVDKTTSDTILN